MSYVPNDISVFASFRVRFQLAFSTVSRGTRRFDRRLSFAGPGRKAKIINYGSIGKKLKKKKRRRFMFENNGLRTHTSNSYGRGGPFYRRGRGTNAAPAAVVDCTGNERRPRRSRRITVGDYVRVHDGRTNLSNGRTDGRTDDDLSTEFCHASHSPPAEAV